jgi:hypothetical protein
LAIVFIIGVLPFAVAFITNAGSSSDGEYQDSISSAYLGQNFPSEYLGGTAHAGKWINNGGLNHTAHYLAQDATPHESNRTYVVDTKCPNAIQPSYAFPKYDEGDCLVQQDLIPSIGVLPMVSKYFKQTHNTVNSIGLNYVGTSGNGPFTILLTSAYFNEIQAGESIDKLKFDLVYTPVDYSCNSAIFENMTFDADITFHSSLGSQRFTGFEFEQNTKYQFEQYDSTHGTYSTVCNVGLVLEFDFTGFETLQISELVSNDWYNTTIELNMDNFKRADDNIPFSTEALPFAGVNSFSIGVQHQVVDPVQAGFIIKTGTLFLSLATFALAIASTPYWDPFKNTFKGMIE